IFELCADGLSLAEITECLNQDKLLAPFKATGRKPGWVKSCVREILYNDRYRGIQVWNRTRKQRNPETGRKVSRPRPESQWKRVDVPEWRVIPEELWKSAHDSLDARRTDFRSSSCTGVRRSSAGKYLFSGLLRCGLCGCNLVIVSGGGTKKKRYGCANYRFHHTCSNNFTIGVSNLENQLIQKFRLKLQDSAHRDLFRNGMSAALTKGVLARQLESFVLTPLSRDGIRQFQVTVNLKVISQPFPKANDHVTVTFLIAC
ncbi:MAG TPA: recombinase family protein, partial [Terriglobales bacterium]